MKPQNFTEINAEKCGEKTFEIESLSVELNAKISLKTKFQCRFVAPHHNSCYKQFGF
ncbi:hypothetical protein FPSM_00623 [Flavobacterium psychrophilum]|nr:hypothetical protein FPSM_00623 [Flavobacterium psychrophilum]